MFNLRLVLLYFILQEDQIYDLVQPVSAGNGNDGIYSTADASAFCEEENAIYSVAYSNKKETTDTQRPPSVASSVNKGVMSGTGEAVRKQPFCLVIS